MAAVGQLAGGVAHEINNPLGVILGFSQSLMRTVKADDPVHMPLASIEREAKRCKSLVQDLLTFSRVNKLERETCDLNEVVSSALTLVAAQTKVQDIELKRNLDEKMPPVRISRNQIQQVLVNLCTNAIDAMPRGGTLSVSTLFPDEMRGDYVQIRVADTGTGIPKEIVGNIFEPFFTTKEVGKGTGLGLSLVYEIVNKHHGTIDVESEVGQGTTFKVNLPLAEK
jgi:signal transduction histidine kinase